MRTEDKLGYLFLGLSLAVWYFNGSPNTISYFFNGMALGFFGKSIYVQIKEKRNK